MADIDANELIARLKALALKLGRTPTRNDFSKEVFGSKNQVDKHFGNHTEFVKAAGLRILKSHFLKDKEPQINVEPLITNPYIPEDDIPAHEIIDSMCKRFTKRKDAHSAKKWMEFKVDTDKPIGLCWFGDPHLDDDGCNWPLLKEHIEICKNTEGMFGANIGDVHNNWVGRLVKEYANQNTSRGTAFKLIEWFFKDAGIRWLLMLLGNHDSWNYGMESLGILAKNVCPMIDWRAQFKIKFSNDRECLIDAAHDHSGHSQWNSLHGQQKASTMGGAAHLYIAGHRHNWALAQNECSQSGRIYWLARARGYKFIDDYAEHLGFGSQKCGASIVTVIDPKASDVNMVRCFADVKEGAEYLKFLRSR